MSGPGRMVGVVLLVIASVLTTGLALHAVASRNALETRLSSSNQQLARTVAASLEAIPAADQPAREWQQVLRELTASGDIAELRIRTPDGRVLLAQSSAAGGKTNVPDWFMSTLPLNPTRGIATIRTAQGGQAELSASSSAAAAHEALWDTASRTAALLTVIGILAALAVVGMLRAWHRLMRRTLDQAQALGQGRFLQADEPMLPVLRPLTRSMNSLVLRLQEASAAQAEQVARLQRQAQLDEVTGLPLRRHFVGRLQQQLAAPGGPGSALIILRIRDLDGLNLRIGHEATDRVLAGAADVLSTYVERAAGIFAGRLNGSDFALCLPLPGLAAETAESLRSALAANPAWRSSRAEWVVGAVDGLRDVGAGQALAEVDAALARAENSGGMAIEPHGEGVQAVVGAIGASAWRAQIGQALDQGRIRLASFDVVDRDGRLIHLECPLRVQLQPGGEYHAAERWLALARRSRLLPEVDLAAVKLALGAVETDHRPRAVHASTAALASPGFIDDLTALLQRAPKAALRLSIECAEAGGPADLAVLARAAAAWRPFGVLIGVEHAGAAPQQMAGLKAAGIDYVKVDSRHVRGAATDDAVRRYALSLVTLIHGLGLSAFAEGIDHGADLQAVWTLGFDGATGPAVSRGVVDS